MGKKWNDVKAENRALRRRMWQRAWAEIQEEFLGEDVMVCVTHKRFLPCRRCDNFEGEYSSDQEDIEMVRRYQNGE